MKTTLSEHLSFDQAKIVLERDEGSDGGKSLHLNGICIQGDIRNANQRVYSSEEIGRAVPLLTHTPSPSAAGRRSTTWTSIRAVPR